jgi:CheY-like chemotaxis protein/HPt (histidine-containing phosphotransfer) domain-containing protein
VSAGPSGPTDGLRARFLPKFVASARDHVRRGLAAIHDDANTASAALHSLAGEACMLGLVDLADIAHAGEDAAARWLADDSTSARVECARALRDLARKLDELEHAAPAAVAGTGQDGACLHRGRVLVVDDSPISGQELYDALADAGVEYVCLASDMPTARAAAGACQPDLILADVNMPGVDLLPLCSQLRQAAARPTTRIVLVSALADDELAHLAETVGADGHVSKQRGIAAIVASVESVLRGEQAS